MTVERVGVSFEPDLLSKFDELIKKKGYENRSEAIRDLVRKYLIENEIEEEGKVIGTITIIYDHEVSNVTDKLLHIQHHHYTEIFSTTHVHVNEHRCLEVIIVRGEAKNVRRLADNIKAIKGVKHGELVLTKTSI
ncbi:MAG TPA: nickel-responsive transcriptional regulator NikR [Thermoplasmatales archaeon]|nr:nickel-responsive transcriptional regulator NikR [Thermoplasmatales archaeon]